MKYEVIYSPKSEEQLRKIPKDIAKRILKKMNDVGETGRGLETLKDNKEIFIENL